MEEKGVHYECLIKPHQKNVTSAKRVAVFKASLKVVREEARTPRSLTMIVNMQYPSEQIAYM